MEGNTEIITYLEQKFSALDAYLEERFDEMASGEELSELEKRLVSEIRRLDGRIDGIYDHLDGITNKVDTYHQEMTMLGSQVSRHERWHHEVAGKLGMRLKS